MALTTWRIAFSPDSGLEPLTVTAHCFDTVFAAVRYHTANLTGGKTEGATITTPTPGEPYSPGSGTLCGPDATEIARYTFTREPGPVDPEVGANAELAGTTHCPACGSPEWNPVDVECENCAAEVAKYDGLLDILAEFDVHVVDEVDDNPERNPHLGFVPFDSTDLPERLLAWRDAAVQAERDRLGLRPEYGILDHGGGLRRAQTEPIQLRTENAAMAVELRAKGIFDPSSRRPASLMRRLATDWSEIPADTTPDDILPGYSEHKAAAATEAKS